MRLQHPSGTATHAAARAVTRAATAGTTDAEAPFGLVTLAPSGDEGGASIGTMRWAQTAG